MNRIIRLAKIRNKIRRRRRKILMIEKKNK
jgi:hypothetical protein